jgi:quercetin dioxygenase-like cupin family protein
MNEEQFRQKLRDEGYTEPEVHEVEPESEKFLKMHTHDQSTMSLVLSGEFTMITESGSRTYKQGDWCENPAGTLHTERIGPEGATALVAKR